MPDVVFPEAGGFSYDLATEIGQVRMRAGDVYQNAAIIADEEITSLLADFGSDLDRTAIAVMDLMETRLMAGDGNSAGQTNQRSQRLDAIRQARQRLRLKMSAAKGPVVTGINKSEKLPSDSNSPIFRRDQWDS
jgi:hypothetical protein